MKFDVVLSSPPFRFDGWKKHVSKHLRLLDNDGCYVLVCPADTSDKLIRDICKRFKTLDVKKVEHYDHLPTIHRDVYYYVWKK